MVGMRPDQRGVSETFAVLLVFALIIVSVGAVALYLLGRFSINVAPNLNLRIIEGQEGGQVLIYRHIGGESVPVGDLKVVLRSGDSYYSFEGNALRTSSQSGVFAPDENVVVGLPQELGEQSVEASLIHKPSGVVLASAIVSVPYTPIWSGLASYFVVLDDSGIPAGTDIGVWFGSPDNNFFEAFYRVDNAPEGVTAARCYNSNDYFGWGVFMEYADNVDLIGAEWLRLWVKTPRPLKIEVEDGRKVTTGLDSSEFTKYWKSSDENEWLELEIPIHEFQGADFGKIWYLIKITSEGRGQTVDFYVDNVRWVFPHLADFTYVQEGANIRFRDTSKTLKGTITSWTWDFLNNGTVDNTERDPIWYNAPVGTHPVKLTVTYSTGKTSRYVGNVTVVGSPSIPDILIYCDSGAYPDMSINLYDGGDNSRNDSPWVASLYEKSPGGSPGDRAKYWKVVYKDGPGHWGGFFTVFNSSMDLSGYTHLSFWVKGEVGGERFAVVLNGGGRELKVNVPNYTSVSKDWSEVLIPLSDFSSHAGSVGFNSLKLPIVVALTHLYAAQDENIYLDNIRYLRETGVASDFSVSVSPSSTTVERGNVVTAKVLVARVGLYREKVRLTLENVPTGVDISFSQEYAVPGFESTMTINVGSSASNGTYHITIRGTGDDGKVRTCTYTLTVGSIPDFMVYNDRGLPGGSNILWWSQSGASEGEYTSGGGVPDDPQKYSWISSDTSTWFGKGVILGSQTNLSSYSNGCLIFWLRVNRALTGDEKFKVEIRGGGVDSCIDPTLYGWNKKLTSWQEVVVPISDFGSVNLEAITHPLKITAEGISSPLQFDIDYIRWSARPTFVLSSNPTSGSVVQGNSTNATVTVRRVGTYGYSVSLGYDAPSGVTVGFSPGSGTPTFTSNMTINVGSSVSPGTYTITIRGTGGDGAVRRCIYTLTVEPLPDFSVSVNPSSGSVAPGGSASATVTVAKIGTYSYSVSLGRDAPSGVTVSFSPGSGAPTFTSNMTINVGSSVSPGTYTITIRGTGGDGKVRTCTYNLTVTSLGDFNISVNPGSGRAGQSTPVTATVTVTRVNNYNESVSLAADNVPGVSVVFNPASGTPTYSSTMTITVGDSATDNTYNITIKGTGGDGKVRTCTYNLTVLKDYYVYADKIDGIPTGTVIYTWSSGGATFNGSYTGENPPERPNSYRTTSTGWAGWGVAYTPYPNPRDLSRFSGGKLKFHVKSPANVKIEIETSSAKHTTFISNHRWDGTNTWQEITIPLSTFGNINLASVTYPFMATIESANTFLIDYVRWTA